MKLPIHISRRGFLRLGLLGSISAGAAVINHLTEQVGFTNWFRWTLRGQMNRWAAPAPVALMRAGTYEEDLLPRVREGWRLAQMPDMRGARLVVKPNLVDSLPGHPLFTDPRVTEAVILLAKEQGAANIVVAEGPTFRRDSRAVLVETGYEELLSRLGVEFVDLNYDDLVRIPLKGGFSRMESLLLARTIHDADLLISVPKLKTHHWTQVSLSIKNLFGIVPGVKYGWPKNTLHIHGIPAFLLELMDSLPVPRRAAVVDGVIAMQGDGPLFGTAISAGVLALGSDFVAVDATCTRLMGFDPTEIDYLRLAAWAGLGQLDSDRVQVVGASLAELQRRFDPPPVIQ